MPGTSSRPRHRIALGLAAVSLTAGLAGGLTACGTASGAQPPVHPAAGGEVTIGLLLPDNRTARYAQFDKPLIEQKIKELCAQCRVEYANAENDVATQHDQVNAMIANGADVLILDPVDARSLRSSVVQAHAAGIPVVAYDRLAEGPVAGYVSFDPGKVGALLSGELLGALKSHHKANAGGQIVIMDGPTTVVRGVAARQARDRPIVDAKVKIGKRDTVASLSAEETYTRMSAAIAGLGPGRIDGVLAGNDTIAAGVIAAFKAAHVSPVPPVTGQDADLAAVQRIVAGDQYMTVYKPYKPEADVAAEMAVALGRGASLRGITKNTTSNATTKDIPTVLLTPSPLTVGTIKDTVVKDGVYTVDQICAPKLASACAKAGLR